MVALAALLSVSLGACSKQTEPKTVKVEAGDMPPEGDWSGVYYSQTFGYLHLVSDGDSAHGRWRTAAGDKWGEMHGEVLGDLFRYEWTEYKIGMVGPNAKSSGKGYFKYIVPEGNAPHEIKGEWGLGDKNHGNPWTAIKQKDVKPEPESIGPDELHKLDTGGWDQGSGEVQEDEEEWD